MIRDLTQFEARKYDLIIVGGGIYGAAICWEAVSRGLKVALFEKADFGSATSANSLKMIHGGFRYLQSGDLLRVKASLRAQRDLMYLAPHLVHPLPVLIPIYGHGLRGKEAFAAGLKLYQAIRSSEVQLDDAEKHIPPGRIISKRECLEILPTLEGEGLNGGVVFYDAQVYNSERLVLSFLHSAREGGAHIANYAEVTGYIARDQQVQGVEIRDVLSGDVFQATSRLVILAGGPWNSQLLGLLGKERTEIAIPHTKAINLVTRQLNKEYAFGIRGRNQHINGEYLADAKTNYLFTAPWRNHTIIGTTYTPVNSSPGDFEINEHDLSFLRNEFNRVFPGEKLSQEDIFLAHGGLLPLSGKKSSQRGLKLEKKSKIIDHSKRGWEGLLSVDGVKYTTARDVAQKAIDHILSEWGYENHPSKRGSARLYGGDIESFEPYLSEAIKANRRNIGDGQVRTLILNYGSIYPHIMQFYRESSSNEAGISADLRLLEAEIRYAVEHEMVQKLGDVVFRRTELGSAGFPGDDHLQYSAQVLGRELGWSEDKISQELAEVKQHFYLYHHLN